MFETKSKLPRLPRDWYCGRAVVFWTHTMEDRATGWLNDAFHAGFREVLLHACSRYGLACPAYVLMPDHWHVVWMGLRGESDQHAATKFLRLHLKRRLGSARFQDRAHDHVLREGERKRNAFMAACHYLRENPARAGLTDDGATWKYFGAIVPGYPDFDPRAETFWEDFWKIYRRLVDSPR